MDERKDVGRTQLVLGLLLIGLGVLFFGARFVGFGFLALWWPGFVLVPGLVMLVVSLFGGKSTAGLAIPGAIAAASGAVLAFQNATGLWQTWAYLWPLVGPGAVGVGLAIFGARTGNARVRTVGGRLALAGLVIAAVLGVFFELVVGLSGPLGPVVGGVLWPVALIAAGLWLIVSRGAKR